MIVATPMPFSVNKLLTKLLSIFETLAFESSVFAVYRRWYPEEYEFAPKKAASHR